MTLQEYLEAVSPDCLFAVGANLYRPKKLLEWIETMSQFWGMEPDHALGLPVVMVNHIVHLEDDQKLALVQTDVELLEGRFPVKSLNGSNNK